MSLIKNMISAEQPRTVGNVTIYDEQFKQSISHMTIPEQLNYLALCVSLSMKCAFTFDDKEINDFWDNVARVNVQSHLKKLAKRYSVSAASLETVTKEYFLNRQGLFRLSNESAKRDLRTSDHIASRYGDGIKVSSRYDNNRISSDDALESDFMLYFIYSYLYPTFKEEGHVCKKCHAYPLEHVLWGTDESHVGSFLKRDSLDVFTIANRRLEEHGLEKYTGILTDIVSETMHLRNYSVYPVANIKNIRNRLGSPAFKHMFKSSIDTLISLSYTGVGSADQMLNTLMKHISDPMYDLNVAPVNEPNPINNITEQAG